MADNPEEKKEGEGEAAAAAPKQSMVPLIIAIVAMPALAYATTTFILLPQLKAAVGAQANAAGGEHGEEGGDGHGDDGHGGGHGDDGHGGGHGDSHGGGHGDGHGGGGGGGGGNTFDLGKVLVNVGGSAGTRYLVANYTLAGKDKGFEDKLTAAKPRLLDIAGSVMSSKSLLDLEQPGARNLIRNELLTAFNNALGGPIVKEVYITEFAIQ